MKVIGIIAEYNPFHNGHLYHLQRAREITGADAVVVVMSGNFVQRGEPAIVDKVRRTQAALACGADVVLELPLSWATGTAERFAQGAVSVLHRLNIVDEIVCGSETPDPGMAEKILDLIDSLDSTNSSSSESDDRTHSTESLDKSADVSSLGCDMSSTGSCNLSVEIHRCMDRGMTYPAARAAVLDTLLPGAGAYLSSPNNILSFEYRKAMRRIPDCHLSLREIPRLGNDYNELSLPEDGRYASASAVRRELLSAYNGKPGSSIRTSEYISDRNSCASGSDVNRNLCASVSPYLPESMLSHLDYIISPDDFSSYLCYSVLTHTTEELAEYQDMNPELARRLKAIVPEHPDYTFTETAEALKSRNITRTRANRALLHVMLGLKSSDSTDSTGGRQIRPDIPKAVKLLGMRRGTPVMRQIMDLSSIPVITKTANASEGVFDEDILAGRLYSRIVYEKSGMLLKDDYRQGPVMYDP